MRKAFFRVLVVFVTLVFFSNQARAIYLPEECGVPEVYAEELIDHIAHVPDSGGDNIFSVIPHIVLNKAGLIQYATFTFTAQTGSTFAVIASGKAIYADLAPTYGRQSIAEALYKIELVTTQLMASAQKQELLAWDAVQRGFGSINTITLPFLSAQIQSALTTMKARNKIIRDLLARTYHTQVSNNINANRARTLAVNLVYPFMNWLKTQVFNSQNGIFYGPATSTYSKFLIWKLINLSYVYDSMHLQKCIQVFLNDFARYPKTHKMPIHRKLFAREILQTNIQYCKEAQDFISKKDACPNLFKICEAINPIETSIINKHHGFTLAPRTILH